MNTQPTRPKVPIRADIAALCVTVVAAPLLLGGAFPWSVVAIAGLALAALATALWERRSAPSCVLDAVFVVMTLAWVWTCLQVMPLPAAVADALGLGSLEAAERLRGLSWAGTVPLTVSYDPGSTRLQIVVGISILAAFVAARLGGPSGLKPIAMATVASAVLLALVGLAHRASGVDALFGVYSPRFTAPHLLTPLMNNNHLGGVSSMGALIAVGLAAERAGRSRHLWIGASVLCASVVIWTLSRGAIGSLLFGLLGLGTWLSAGARGHRRRGAIPLTVTGAAIAGVFVFAGLEPILRRFESDGIDKLRAAMHGFRLLEGSTWWLGVGRGAFSATFVAKAGSLNRYTHPENLLVQWTTEWGVPIAVGVLVIVAWALWKRFRTTDEPIVAAVCIAIFALSLQNLVDFSLEMAGVVVIVASLLGVLLPVTKERSPRKSWRVSLVALGLFAIAFTALGPRVFRSDPQSIADELTRFMQADEEGAFQATLNRGLTLHPGEPAFALLAGTYAGMKKRPDATRWLSIAMEEAPGWAAPHVVAARLLYAEGRTDQALIEIREAEERQARGGYPLLCEILTRYPNMDYVERAAPSAELRINFLDGTASCPGLPVELLAQIDAKILTVEPTRTGPVLRQSHRLVTQGRADEATRLLDDAVQARLDDGRLRLALVRAHLSGGDPLQARAALEQARSRGIESRALLQAQARIETALGETDAMRATITRLRGQARGNVTLIAQSFMLQGELEASSGNIDEALAAYAAADEVSRATSALQQAAALALMSDRPTQARRFYQTLCKRAPGGPACEQEARLAE